MERKLSRRLASSPGLLLPHLVNSAGKVLTRGPAVVLRQFRKRRLRAGFLRGQASHSRNLDYEETDPEIVEYGRVARAQHIEANRLKHAGRGYRVLMFQPDSITAEIWFRDLQQCMQHAGIECRVLGPGVRSADVNRAFEEFQPNIFISTEAASSLRAIDLDFIRSYKRRHGCLRLFIPVWHADSPRAHVPPGRSTPAIDEWRRQLCCKGLTADAHFSIFEPEFHDIFSRDRRGPAIEYVAIPQGCNPFIDRPVSAVKLHDYIMVTSMTDERVEVSYRFLRPIVARYRGVWGGAHWGFGVEDGIQPAQMPLLYAQTRIALSPLVGFVYHYSAEITHRVFATAACGVFQITMPTKITNRFFTEDELVQAATPGEFSRLFDHYVRRPQERNKAALAALRRVYAGHTCFDRVDTLVSHCDSWRRRGLF
jgi:hypothetical protein